VSAQDPARWLIVIPQDQRELFERLRQSLPADAPFNVILDRRQGERPGADPSAPQTEPRRAERRQPQPVGLVYVRAIARAAPAVPSPAVLRGEPSIVVTAACPSCLQALSFELPRFPRPPARLDAEVVHVASGSAPQHFAEIQAYTVSGRPLLVGRVQVFRPQGEAGVTPDG
jgi:hypothetical protein